jgi:hypothetical protein
MWGFVVDKVALGQVLLRVVRCFPIRYHSSVADHNHVSPGGMNNTPVGGCSSETQAHPIDMNINNVTDVAGYWLLLRGGVVESVPYTAAIFCSIVRLHLSYNHS